jgi:hypothetical protein
MIIRTLSKRREHGTIPGTCAACGLPVYESLPLLDDAYNVWAGKCPQCGAINMLSMNHGLRGYTSMQMWLVLPTDEEREANALPKDCPTQGSKGPADAHGTPLGEFVHQLTKGM